MWKETELLVRNRLPDPVDDAPTPGDGRGAGIDEVGSVAADGDDRDPQVEGHLGDAVVGGQQAARAGALRKDEQVEADRDGFAIELDETGHHRVEQPPM